MSISNMTISDRYISDSNMTRLRKVMSMISIVLFMSSVMLVAVKGFNWGLDFTGGVVAEVQLSDQVTKDALIIDDRYNGGGFIPDRMIELLSRKTLNYWKFRGLKPNATPLIAHDGPKAMLINGYSSSGGDALPYYFRKLGLGKLIGTRTWGGLIGISGNPGLADGGSILASTFRFMDTEGNWKVENEGVSPDIEVIDRPELIATGKDPSIERAVEELLKDLAKNPRSLIESPPAPDEF